MTLEGRKQVWSVHAHPPMGLETGVLNRSLEEMSTMQATNAKTLHRSPPGGSMDAPLLDIQVVFWCRFRFHFVS